MQPPLIPSGQQIQIVHGDQKATAVSVGGGIRCYQVAGHDVLDGYALDEMAPSARGQPLIPWPNRLADGNYTFTGRAHQLALSEPERHNAIHGLVRFANWSIAEQSIHHVALAHRLHPQPGYPFVLDLRVTYRLDKSGLSVQMEATNRGSEPCPIGLGAHPYVRLGSGRLDSLTLQCPAGIWYPTDEQGIPTGRRPVDDSVYDFRQPRPIGTTQLDTAFTELHRDADGRASVTLSDDSSSARISVWADQSCPYLMLFTGDSLPDPAKRRHSLGVEPMSCAPNAFRSGDGLVTLEPGQSTGAGWGITAEFGEPKSDA